MFIGPIIPLAKKLFLIKWDVLIQHGNKMNLWSFDPIMYCKNEKRVMYGLKVIRLRYNFALHNNVIYYQVVILYVFYCSGFGLNMPQALKYSTNFIIFFQVSIPCKLLYSIQNQNHRFHHSSSDILSWISRNLIIKQYICLTNFNVQNNYHP